MVNQTKRIAELELEKELSQVLEKLASKFEQLEQREQKQQIQEQFVKKLTDLKITVSFAKGRSIDSLDQLDKVVSEVEADYIQSKK